MNDANDNKKTKKQLIDELRELRLKLEKAEAKQSGIKPAENGQDSQQVKLLGMLAGGIAHSFNNMLTALIGNISLAKMYAKPGLEVFDILAEAEKATIRAKSLAHQILTFSRTGVLIRKVISFGKIINDSVSYALSGSNKRLKFVMPDDLWMIEADESQISQAINSLLIHVEQSIPEGSEIRIIVENVILGISNSFQLKAGRYLKTFLQIKDVVINGEDIRYLSDPEFAIGSGGKNLGLAAAHFLLKRHNGHIAIESKEDAGTTFFIFLPAYEGRQTAAKDEIKSSFVSENRGRVLVMDDEEIVRTVTRRMLAQCGYEADFAKNSSEAIVLYQQSKATGRTYNAVIIDLIIEGSEGGEETIKKLLEIDPDVSAIVSSGYSNDPIMADFRKYGFKSLLPKPYRLEEISQVLNKVIGER
jgi:CheY-like chemotaxis protein